MKLSAAAAMIAFLSAVPAWANDSVILRINFTPWAMHAQYYAGLAQGIYRQEGIDLEIRPPSGGQQNEVFIGTGREQFGVSNADSFIKARANGLPVVAILADEPDTPFAIISLKNENLTTPAQLKGKKLTWFQGNVRGLLDPMLSGAGLQQSDINFVNIARGSEVQMLAARQVDAVFGYNFGQALTLEERGFPVNVMALRDYGVKFYGTVIYTNEALLKSNPDLVKRFVRATLKSLIWTRDHEQQAIAEVVKVSPDREQALESKKLAIIYDLYKSPDYADRFGEMTDAKWQSSIDLLGAADDLPRKPSPKEMYTNVFIDALDEAKTLAARIQHP